MVSLDVEEDDDTSNIVNYFVLLFPVSHSFLNQFVTGPVRVVLQPERKHHAHYLFIRNELPHSV